MIEMSEASMEVGVGTPCLERLQREALDCLDTFPFKVTELNGIIESHIPHAVKTGNGHLDAQVAPKTASSLHLDFEASVNPETDVASRFSGSTRMQTRPSRGICKRRYYRMRGFEGSVTRIRPGPLGQLLAFLAGKMVSCTRTLLMTPSWYILESLISVLLQRRELKNARCGPSTWGGSLASFRISPPKEDSTCLSGFIDLLRPAAVQLIADTTVLKRWLQALALTSPPSSELRNATRSTETIDCWAYEFFFHLKYLRVKRVRGADKVRGFAMNDDNLHTSLWHRLVQMRDNYVILYETLSDDQKIQDAISPT